jgi:nucleoside-diphosphate-sugar epimerase
VKQLVDVAHRLRLSSVSGDWVQLMRFPILVDTSRAKEQLGWNPAYTSEGALRSAANALFGRA